MIVPGEVGADDGLAKLCHGLADGVVEGRRAVAPTEQQRAGQFAIDDAYLPVAGNRVIPARPFPAVDFAALTVRFADVGVHRGVDERGVEEGELRQPVVPAGHIARGDFALARAIEPDARGHPAVERRVVGLGAITGGVDVGQVGACTIIDLDAAPDVQPRHVREDGMDAHGLHEDVEVPCFAALEARSVPFHALDGVAEEKIDAIGPHLCLKPRGSRCVEERLADEAAALHHGDVADAHLVQCPRQFQAQDAAAEDERAPAVAQARLDLLRVGEVAEDEALVQPFDGEAVGLRAGGDQQLAVGEGLAAVQVDRVRARVDARHVSRQRFDAHIRVECLGASNDGDVVQFAGEPLGHRCAVVVGHPLVADDADATCLIYAADFLRCRDPGDAVADDDVVRGRHCAPPRVARVASSAATINSHSGMSASLNGSWKLSQQVTHSTAIPWPPFSATICNFSSCNLWLRSGLAWML